MAEAHCVEEVFDAVVVATGHYSQPKLPSIQRMGDWKLRQLHSHWYRVPDPFRDEVVVLVGCGDSGTDIALDLLAVAREVHLSAKAVEAAMTSAISKMLARHANLHLHPQIERLCDDGRVVFADGGVVAAADTVMYCSGYRYSFPFLDIEGKVTVDDDNRVGPLFERTFPPSLSFIGIPRKVMVPWFFEAQGRWIAGVLSGWWALPSEEEMMRSEEADVATLTCGAHMGPTLTQPPHKAPKAAPQQYRSIFKQEHPISGRPVHEIFDCVASLGSRPS
uniref:Flavin-containing monooxygenase n=1 Tax=Oryza meridionalis TaxID=40149 RepID=A0A0E0CDP8_9ORYZ